MIYLIQATSKKLPLDDKSIHCAVTSPPYWLLRDYEVEGQIGAEPLHDCMAWTRGEFPCSNCNVCAMRSVGGEIWRVLRDDGTFWLNLDDKYNGSGGAGGDYNPGGSRYGQPRYPRCRVKGLAVKNMLGIPWRVAFALQADGWILRLDGIWNKPDVRPEGGAYDRPSRCHEYVFILAKSRKYYFDKVAIEEESVTEDPRYEATKRARRSVWDIHTGQYKGAHFATFPVDLPALAIQGGTSEKGCCPECRKPWVRQRRVVSQFQRRWGEGNADGSPYKKQSSKQNVYEDLGFFPSCDCDAGDPIPCTVLDPFVGSGTTLVAANLLGRNGIGVDLSLDYLLQAQERTGLKGLLEWGEGISSVLDVSDLPLFAMNEEV